MSFFLRGLIIGVSIAAPVGPIGLLCIHRTLVKGRLSGFISGLGAATADATYGSIAAFGLTALSTFLIHGKVALGIVGGAFLCYLGVKTSAAKPRDHAAEATSGNLLGDYGSTVLLTLANPMTVLSFVAVFAGLGLANARPDYGASTEMVAGVFAGSALWWLALSWTIGRFHKQLSARTTVMINRLSGIAIFAFGVYAFTRALW